MNVAIEWILHLDTDSASFEPLNNQLSRAVAAVADREQCALAIQRTPI